MSSLESTDASIDVWAVRLRAPDALVDRFATLLSEDELSRAAHFRREHLRKRFVLAHGSLRTLLACYLMSNPTEICFKCGTHGKPSIIRPATDLRFNQSDSGDLVVFAFARGFEIGVDVEALRPVPDMEHLARSVFSEGEIIDLLDLPARFRPDAFFAAWTRKEAYIKAIGTGMNCPLDSFQVTLRPGEEARIVKIGRNSDAADQWSMHTFDPEAGYSAALAYPGPKREIQWMPVREAAELIWAV